MSRRTATAVIALLSSVGLVGVAAAQQQPEPQQDQASACQQDLQTLGLQMREDGYWLAGYPRTGMMGGAQFPGDQATVPGQATGLDSPAAGADPTVPAEDQMAAQHPRGPWGATGWQHQPQGEMRILYQSAMVLDRQGHDEACGAVVQAMAAQYQQQVEQLQELGVDPAEVATWRQAQIAEARPATEAFDQVRVDRIMGMNVRSPEDEDFGDIGDVLIDPQTGAVDYVTVTRGGFFGIGEDEVVVPWDRLYVTADFASFVLPVDAPTLDAAPTGTSDREEVDTFWQQTGGDPAGDRAQ